MNSSLWFSFKTETNVNHHKEGRKETAKKPCHFWVLDENSGLAVWAVRVP